MISRVSWGKDSLWLVAALVGLYGCGSPFGPNAFRGPGGYPVQSGSPYYGQQPQNTPVTWNDPAVTPISLPRTTPGTVTPAPSSGGTPTDLGGISLTPTANWQGATSIPVLRGQGTQPTYQQPLALVAGSGQMIDGRMVPLNSEPRRPSVPHMKSSVHPHSRADLVQRKRVSIAQNQALAAGVPRTPEEDLKYRGGKTVRDLAYVNIFVGGKELWNPSDRENIDWAMEAALQDPNLNHVMMQYFDDQPISAEALGSFYLSGYKPKVVLQSNIRDVVTSLYKSGAFKGLPLTRTCINFLLPQGATLEDPNTARAEAIHKANPAIPFEDEATSREGLGGYHGSVHLGAETVYYAVCVYSERRADGFTNGIPAFPEPWKSTAATFYHELQEFRTDADVDDAMEGRANALGWTSDTGLECGDFPLSEAPTLQSMFQDVPLSDGRGVVPVQFQYSNAVHGPEGPIDAPHRGKPLPLPAKRLPPPGTSPSPPPVKPTPPVTADEGLETLVKNWKRLPQQTRDQILRLLQNGGQ